MNKQERINIGKERLDEFEELYMFIKTYTAEQIAMYCYEEVLKAKLKDTKHNEISIDKNVAIEHAKTTSIGCYKTFFYGGSKIWDWINDLKQYIEEYKQVYNLLYDEKSKRTFVEIILYRLFLEREYLTRDYVKDEYFHPELLPKRERAIYVDCGSYNGDTARRYKDVYGACEKMYLFEPMPDVYQELLNKTSFANAIYLNKAVADEIGFMNFTSNMSLDSANKLSPKGDKQVEVTSLDEEIKEKVTFIKMDIEGAEQTAINGAAKHIIGDKPQLAICVYHVLSDLRKIPLIIYEMNKRQKFYLRYHGQGVPQEIVFYANPIID